MRPWDNDFTNEEFDGLFISNGPGNPEACEATIRHLHKVAEGRPSLPIFGILRSSAGSTEFCHHPWRGEAALEILAVPC